MFLRGLWLHQIYASLHKLTHVHKAQFDVDRPRKIQQLSKDIFDSGNFPDSDVQTPPIKAFQINVSLEIHVDR
jgi:hypothetical protein